MSYRFKGMAGFAIGVAAFWGVPMTGLAASPIQDAGAVVCTDPKALVQSLRAEDLPVASTPLSLDWSSALKTEHLNIVHIARLSGTCANEARAYKIGFIRFRKDAIIVMEQGKLSVPDRPMAPFFDDWSIDANGPHPQDVPGVFIGAAKRDSVRIANDLSEIYVGLWDQAGPDGEISKLVVFTHHADGHFSGVRPLLESKFRLRSVAYFPSPDTPSGGLDLLQETPDGIYLIGMMWHHPNDLNR